MHKPDLLKQIVDKLKANLQVLQEAARTSHAEATDESSRSENKYDTRGLEAGYLAQGQARKARELVDALQCYDALELRNFTPTDAIDLTAVIQLDADGAPATYFMGPTSGGLEIDIPGGKLLVITPASPLGQALMGKKTGQSWTAKIGGTPIQYRIRAVT